MSCPTCGKSGRPLLYCHRPDCGQSDGSLAALKTSVPRSYYNQLLGKASSETAWICDLATTAYSLAQTEESGPKLTLLRIADAASSFASLISRAKPL